MGRKAVVIANALDAEFHAQAKSPPHRESRRGPCTIGFVAAGALSNRNKGFQDLAGALSHLSLEKRQAIRLLIVGDVGHDSIPRIEGVEIHTIGSLQQRAKMIEAYLQMDCCVVPSHSENLPNVIVEAMCLGIPTIATNVGGIPELITDHETGFLAAPSNPESLARALDYFLSYGDVNELASRARKYALSKTSPEIVAAQYLDVYATAQQTYWSGAPQRSGARSTQV
jgi:glycosyltransferase involved in cell wall biosynthesis